MSATSLFLKFSAGLIVVGAVATGTGSFFAWKKVQQIQKTLPPIEQLLQYKPMEPSEIFSRSGEKIGEIFTERRYPLEYKEMNPLIVDAFIAAEDMRFFDHWGVDVIGIGRAAFRYISKSSGNVQGGSTITQQLAKNILLTRERTVERKIKDILLAIEIEKVLPKEKILELYLNTIFLGNNSYGIEAAARNYFRKGNRELNLAEATLIAGLAPAPSAYNPVEDQQKAKARQKFVLDQLTKMGRITPEQAKAAYSQKIDVFRAESPNATAAPYFFAEVRKQLDSLLESHKLSSEGYRIHTTVDLTLQQETQRIIQEKLKDFGSKRTFRGATKQHGAEFEIALKEIITQQHPEDSIVNAVVTNSFPEHGFLGIVSAKGLGLLLEEDHTWALSNSNESTATETSPSGRPSPKTFTNLLKVGDQVRVRLISRKTPTRIAQNLDSVQVLSKYLALFPKNGMKPEVKFFELADSDDVEAAAVVANGETGEVLAMVGGHDFSETQFNRASQSKRQVGSSVKPLYYAMALDHGFSPASLLDSPPIVIGDWRPENYTKEFTGRATLRRSLIQSYNIQSIQLTQALGLQKCVQHFERLGLDWDIKNGGFSLALGSGGATLVQMTQAYTPFANQGRLQQLHYISKILDRQGNVVFSWENNADKLSAAPIKKMFVEETQKQESKDGDADEPNTPHEINNTNAPRYYWKFDPKNPLQVLSPAATFSINNVLQDVIKQGTGTAAQGVSPSAGGKTGTTNAYTDAWFLGFVPGYVGGVWIGFDDPVKSLGPGSTGGKIAAPFWREIMKKVVETQPQKSLPEPEGVRWVKIDTNTGKPSQSGLSMPMVQGTEPESPHARNALGVLGVDSNTHSPESNKEDADTSALRSQF
jgi:penicillin-binding protein 1A